MVLRRSQFGPIVLLVVSLYWVVSVPLERPLPWHLSWPVEALFVANLVGSGRQVVRNRRDSWVLRVSDAGVTIDGRVALAWTDLDHAEMPSTGGRSVTFVPRAQPPVTLTGLPLNTRSVTLVDQLQRHGVRIRRTQQTPLLDRLTAKFRRR